MCFSFMTLTSYSQEVTYSRGPQTALDFLVLSIDSRSSAMGDIGIATTADGYSHLHNPSKYLSGDNKGGVAFAYSPWLRNLVKDMNIAALSGYYVFDTMQSLSTSFRYFAMGDMEFRDESAQYTGSHSPFQMSLDVAYSRRLSQYFSASITFRYALANLYPAVSGYKKGHGLAADLGVFFQKGLEIGKLPSKITAGASLSNLGTKVSFKKESVGYFMPMEFKLGAGLATNFDKQNSLMLAGELSRSLVPTKNDKLDDSSISGMFSSIGEGNFRSIVWALGAEYNWSNILFGRMGYRHEGAKSVLNRKYLSFGAGFAYNVFSFDFSYLIPTGERNNSMGNTLRLSIAIDIAK